MDQVAAVSKKTRDGIRQVARDLAPSPKRASEERFTRGRHVPHTAGAVLQDELLVSGGHFS
jgi:hypothetical protein